MFYFRRVFTIFKDLVTNDGISDNLDVRVKDETGAMLGIMRAAEAKVIADERHLDLVMITPNAQPPVCQIMDYGKYRFDSAKKAKDAQKNQKKPDVKEIRLSITIDTGDVNTKSKQARKFLEGGDKVKVSIRMRGRQMARPQMGVDIMYSFFETVKDVATMERKPAVDGRSIIMNLVPIVNK
ncbi:MAG: translation initiation factor IF-3 [Clostridiales bacterium]|nr:translation initiation factor IF-3 [Clostridiales bacterium]